MRFSTPGQLRYRVSQSVLQGTTFCILAGISIDALVPGQSSLQEVEAAHFGLALMQMVSK